MDRNMEDAKIKQVLEEIFIDKRKMVSIAQPHVLGAIITAASEMSRCSNGIATPKMTQDQLLDLYSKTKDSEVQNLIGMNSGYVKAATGYSVQFEDMNSAEINYRIDKDRYDNLYQKIAERADIMLKEKVEGLFLKKDVSTKEPHILASMITAASEMSRCSSDVADPSMTTDQLLDLYQKTGDQTVEGLIGMSSNYVKNNIGYSVQFEDASAAQINYQSDKESYDALYQTIAERANKKQQKVEKIF